VTTTTHTITYGCKVSKTNKNGKEVVPPDQQVSGLTYSWETQVTGSHDEHLGPTTLPLAQPVLIESDVFICHNPNNAGWGAKNGYDNSLGTCSALASSLST
jgi:hypothetical protein